ncbi:hypothetical protein J3R82DRAFT_8555 [Butyriboletus roseoflavus]|nr:hypothetical protein J3R82DRAFT_8555 [Butyriboletus roseoflavus]
MVNIPQRCDQAYPADNYDSPSARVMKVWRRVQLDGPVREQIVPNVRNFRIRPHAHALSAVSRTSLSLLHTKTFPQSAPIVDFTWYPGASQHNLPTFCFVASVRDCPVKLLDGRDGRLRASYSIVDHRERRIAPHSLAFNLAAAKLYCGFEDAIEIFDVQRPGEGERLPTTPSKKSKDGLKGERSVLDYGACLTQIPLRFPCTLPRLSIRVLCCWEPYSSFTCI